MLDVIIAAAMLGFGYALAAWQIYRSRRAIDSYIEPKEN